jgi:iron complex transport system substrate-binding protein
MDENITRENEAVVRSRKAAWGRHSFMWIILLLILVAVGGIETARRLGQDVVPSGVPPIEAKGGSAGAGYPRALRDGGGELITIPARPRRIVSQTLGTDEILLDICERERIVAFSEVALDPKYSPLAPSLRGALALSTDAAEEIIQLDPDLIFVASYSRAELVEQLKSAGAPVFRFTNFARLEAIAQNIRTVGRAVGEESRAEELAARMERELEDIRAGIPPAAKPPRVMSYGRSGNTAGADTSFDAVARAAGAINVTAEKGLKGYPKISAELLAEWQPDYIVVGAEVGK